MCCVVSFSTPRKGVFWSGGPTYADSTQCFERYRGHGRTRPCCSRMRGHRTSHRGGCDGREGVRARRGVLQRTLRDRGSWFQRQALWRRWRRTVAERHQGGADQGQRQDGRGELPRGHRGARGHGDPAGYHTVQPRQSCGVSNKGDVTQFRLRPEPLFMIFVDSGFVF